MTYARRDRQAGITLIEMLVVLAVIGVAGGVTMMAGGDQGRGARDEAVLLARRLSLGVDEALILGTPLALLWDATGYRFVQSPAGGQVEGPDSWPAAPQRLGLRHDLQDTLELRQSDGAKAVPVLLPTSAAAPTVVLEVIGGGTRWNVIFDGFTATAQSRGDT